MGSKTATRGKASEKDPCSQEQQSERVQKEAIFPEAPGEACGGVQGGCGEEEAPVRCGPLLKKTNASSAGLAQQEVPEVNPVASAGAGEAAPAPAELGTARGKREPTRQAVKPAGARSGADAVRFLEGTLGEGNMEGEGQYGKRGRRRHNAAPTRKRRRDNTGDCAALLCRSREEVRHFCKLCLSRLPYPTCREGRIGLLVTGRK